MSQLPTQTVSSVPPSLPEQFLSQYNKLAEQWTSGFQGRFNRVRIGKADFTLIEAGVERRVQNGRLVGILLGFSDIDFCTWYERQYVVGQEPEEPDLCWNWPDHSQFPAALPEHLRVKQLIDGVERWKFRIARRSVWALAQVNQQTGEWTLGLQNPYILDITSASQFGKSNTHLNEYKWSGLMGFCNRFSQPPNFYCSPSMFMTQIMIDLASPVPGVVVFRPSMTSDMTGPQYIDNTTFEAVVNTMLSQQVQDMLKVKEILDYPKVKQTPIPPQQMAEPAQPVYQQPPMQQQAQPVQQPVQQQPVQQPVTAPLQDVVPPMPQPQPEQAPQVPPVQTAQAPVNEPVGSLLEQAEQILSGNAPQQPVAQPVPTAPVNDVVEQPVPTAPVNESVAQPGQTQQGQKKNLNPVTANAINNLTEMLS
ncbi:MAG: hypothetical protein HDQ88_09420 [Clostridia bacterium]|nr:hypothetical protein [Clostridia bacterium]